MTHPLLSSPLLTQAGFAHAFSTRHGGAHMLGVEPDALYQTVQVHGARLLTASGDSKAFASLEADALAAEPGSGHAVLVRVADCVPVLIANPSSGAVVAAHAGWRGIEANIVAVGVRHLAPEGHESAHLIAAIGPCIGPCCFEVGRDVGARIVGASSPEALAREAGDKMFIDLRHAVRAQLRALGLPGRAIDDVPSSGREGCTRCNPEHFHSYRRDGSSSGRLVGVIVAR